MDVNGTVTSELQNPPPFELVSDRRCQIHLQGLDLHCGMVVKGESIERVVLAVPLQMARQWLSLLDRPDLLDELSPRGDRPWIVVAELFHTLHVDKRLCTLDGEEPLASEEG